MTTTIEHIIYIGRFLKHDNPDLRILRWYCAKHKLSWKIYPESVKELFRRHKIVNGCGGKRLGFLLPRTMYEASCEHHDYNYWLGYTSQERAKADWQFFVAMLKDAETMRNTVAWWHISLAFTFYTAVRLFGFMCYDYSVPGFWEVVE